MVTLQTLLGIELPIIQAPMAGVQDSRLAVAVSNAGGLGSLPCAMLSRDVMRKELAHIAAHTTRPYNVNFFCHTPPKPNAEREARTSAAAAGRQDRRTTLPRPETTETAPVVPPQQRSSPHEK